MASECNILWEPFTVSGPKFRESMKTPTTLHRGFRDNRAFTLIELMMAATIVVMVATAAGVLLIVSTKVYSTDANQLATNYDIHKLTLEMETDAAFANEFYIYDVDTNGTPDNSPTPVTQGQSGDLLLLMTTQTATTGAITITRIIAYCRGTPATQTGSPTAGVAPPASSPLPIYRYDSGTISEPSTDSIITRYDTYIKTPLTNIIALKQQFLPTGKVVGTATDNPLPTAGQTHTNLFYNLGGGSAGSTGAFMVLSQIYEQQNNATVLSIDTYNLTMWPRS